MGLADVSLRYEKGINVMALKKIRKENYPEWYQAVVAEADMAENSSSPGCMVIKPWGIT